MVKTATVAPYISEEFRKAVTLHIYKLYDQRFSMGAPLILCVHGPSGEGKTFQCQHILRDLQVELFQIDISSFEDKHAGVPAKTIRDRYNDAVSFYQKCSHWSCVFINDFDLAIGNFGQLHQYTVNTQQINGVLMSLADYDPSRPVRVPIVITCNDMTKLYKPLIRAGRMQSYFWDPNREDKCKMVQGVFPDRTSSECVKLVQDFEQEAKRLGLSVVPPISFYSAVANSAPDNALWESLNRQAPTRPGVPQNLMTHPTLKDIYEAGMNRLQEIARGNRSYLEV